MLIEKNESKRVHYIRPNTKRLGCLSMAGSLCQELFIENHNYRS